MYEKNTTNFSTHLQVTQQLSKQRFFSCPRAAAPGGKVNLPAQRGSAWLVKVGDLVVWRCESQLTLSPLKTNVYVYVYVYIIYL